MATPALDVCRPISRPSLAEEDAVDLERVFQALADRHRVKMLNILLRAEGEVCVCEVQDALGLKQATASYHLRQLVDAGLATRTRRGTYSYYRLVPGSLGRVAALLGSA